MLRPLENESIERLECIFNTAGGDTSVLSSLELELQHRPTSRARVLRLKVIAARMAARQKVGGVGHTENVGNESTPKGGAAAAQPATTHLLRPLQALLAKYNLREPDGRPLHAYRLDADMGGDKC